MRLLGLLITVTAVLLLLQALLALFANNISSSSPIHTEVIELASSPADFPDACSSQQLETIAYQLPADECSRTKRHPWANKCSFSYATRCPASDWLTSYYTAAHSSTTNKNSPRTAFYVGCNKGMDAVATLRMLSANTTIAKDVWRNSFFQTKETKEIEAGRCQQEFDADFDLNYQPALTTQQDATVFCVEAMPVTAAHLARTAEQLKWQSSFRTIHAAVGDYDKEVLFPSADKIGVEDLGLGDCRGANHKCQAVQQYTLDSLVQNNVPDNNSIVDFVSVDVEGFDWPVLLGGASALSRTRYVEFEYNWKQAWVSHALSTVIGSMKDRGFVCYWAGDKGYLWRITDCWMDHYDLKFWSNVACVNIKLSDPMKPSLADRMEAIFLDTMAAGKSARYDKPVPMKEVKK